MSEHSCTIHWRNAGKDMVYEAYSRDHTWEFEGGPVVPASAAPGYGGGAACVDPEEALVAAVSSCHMLTFLAIAAKKKLVVADYTDRAVGHLEKNADGVVAVTRIELRPVVTFAAGVTVSPADLGRLHDSAHRNCFIANSVKCAVSVAG